jgi:hypothetical protein
MHRNRIPDYLHHKAGGQSFVRFSGQNLHRQPAER